MFRPLTAAPRAALIALLLLTGGLAPGAAGAQPALNHVYVVLDQPTFDAVRRDPAVAALLGRSDGGLPDYAPPRADADRVFFRGRTTYLELFGPKNRFNEPVGKVGIAVGEDDPARFERLARHWQDHCPEGFSRAPVAWTRSQPPVPWYDSVQCRDTAEGDEVSVWAMVYRPAFGSWQTGAPTTVRQAILAPHATGGQGVFDITGVALDVPAALRERLRRQFVAAGFKARPRDNGVEIGGDGWSLTLRDARAGAARSGVVHVRTRAGERRSLCLGSRQGQAARSEPVIIGRDGCRS